METQPSSHTLVLAMPLPKKRAFPPDAELFRVGNAARELMAKQVALGEEEWELLSVVQEFCCQVSGCTQRFHTVHSFESHYASAHRNVCRLCRRVFPSARLLSLHILETHDTLFKLMAEKKKMYECLVEGCGRKFSTSRTRRLHLIDKHQFPKTFHFDGGGFRRPRVAHPPRARGRGAQQRDQRDQRDAMIVDEASNARRSAVPSSLKFGHGTDRGFLTQESRERGIIRGKRGGRGGPCLLRRGRGRGRGFSVSTAIDPDPEDGVPETENVLLAAACTQSTSGGVDGMQE